MSVQASGEDARARIEKNASALVIAQAIKSPLALLASGLLGRALGPSGLGRLMQALAVTGILRIVMGLGTGGVAVREVSQRRREGGSFFRKVATVNGVSTALVAAVATAIAYATVGDRTRLTLWVVCLGFVASDSFCDVLASFFRGYERMELEAVVLVVERIAFVACVGGLMALGGNAAAGAACYLFASLLRAGASGCFLARTLNPQRSSARSVMWLLKEAAPFAARKGLSVVLTRAPIIALARYQARLQVGRYGAAERLFEGSYFLPLAIAASAYPSLSRAKTVGIDEMRSQFSTALATALGVGIAVATTWFALAKPAVAVIYGGEFAPTALYLTILVWAMPVMAIGLTCSVFLAAVDRQATVTLIVGFSAAVQAAVCVLVARQEWGGVGICLSWIGSYAVMAVASYRAVRRFLPGPFPPNNLARVVLGGLALAGVGVVCRYLSAAAALPLLLVSTSLYALWADLATPRTFRALVAAWRRDLQAGDER